MVPVWSSESDWATRGVAQEPGDDSVLIEQGVVKECDGSPVPNEVGFACCSSYKATSLSSGSIASRDTDAPGQSSW